MKKTIVLVLALGTGVVFAEFKAGFARVDATPPLGIPIVGYFHKRIADGVLDPLYLDCVAVSDGTNNALIYCVSSLGLGKAFMGKATPALTAATGVPRERIYVHATHTHTGPAAWTRSSFTKEENSLVAGYVDTCIAKMAEAGKMALADMAPARIGVAKTVCRSSSASAARVPPTSPSSTSAPIPTPSAARNIRPTGRESSAARLRRQSATG